jgi:type II secretory pathway pseudopilin PulG
MGDSQTPTTGIVASGFLSCHLCNVKIKPGTIRACRFRTSFMKGHIMKILKARATIEKSPSSMLPAKQPRISRPAFNLLELLIILAIIGVLVALLMPTTQKVREASHRTLAHSNMQQARLAAQGDGEAPLAAKVIYDANLELLVADFEEAEVELAKRIKENKGYVAQSDITGANSHSRHGHWIIRVPQEHFETLLEAVVKLGVIEDRYTDSRSVLDTKDVSEEYADVDSRVKNKKAEESRLLKHLDKSTGNLQDILAVERELTRVRGEIEQQERRLKVMQNQTALATVTIVLNEKRTLGFLDNVQTTFQQSLEALISLGRGMALAAVAAAPWLAVICVVVVPGWPLIRRLARRGRAQMGVAS